MAKSPHLVPSAEGACSRRVAVDRQGRIDACWFGTGAVTYGNILRPWDPNYIEINTYKTASRDEACWPQSSRAVKRTE